MFTKFVAAVYCPLYENDMSESEQIVIKSEFAFLVTVDANITKNDFLNQTDKF